MECRGRGPLGPRAVHDISKQLSESRRPNSYRASAASGGEKNLCGEPSTKGGSTRTASYHDNHQSRAPTLDQETLNLPERQRLADLHPHREADHVGPVVDRSEWIAYCRMLDNVGQSFMPIALKFLSDGMRTGSAVKFIDFYIARHKLICPCL